MDSTFPSPENNHDANGVEQVATFSAVADFKNAVERELQKIIVGQHNAIEFLVIALLCDGHVLLEGVPGIAKTLMAKLLAQSLDLPFARLQFTPDLMPSDILGTMVYNVQSATFSFNKGPIFKSVILIDEINRAPAKTQSALFEVMEERQITIEGMTHKMPPPFFVIATQNPIEQEGTYRLPEAQLDRFMFKIVMPYPSLSEEQNILARFKDDFKQHQISNVQPIFTLADIERARAEVQTVAIHDDIIKYIASIVEATRRNADIMLGASPRASLNILKGAKVVAALRNRNFVTPDDVQTVLQAVLNHRIVLTPEAEMDGITIQEILKSIIETIEVPR